MMKMLMGMLIVLLGSTAAHAEPVRVVEEADESVVVIVAAPSARRPRESDDAFYPRIFKETLTQNPSWQNRPFVDLDRSVLPKDRLQRYAWRLDGQQVVVDPTASIPQAMLNEQAAQALRASAFAKLIAMGLTKAEAQEITK
jgi:hypothetical protein